MTVHLFISGQVQGVGFRQFVKSHAKKEQVKGFVKNLPDGRVEAVLQGEENAVEKLYLLCQKGPFLAVVDSVVREKMETKEVFNDFSIVA